MGFYKTAQVESLGTAFSGEDGQVTRQAAIAKAGVSHYLEDGTQEIDFSDILGKVAERYDISPDPRDYFFEAIRANTVNVPNENHDAFHKDELLRHDKSIQGPVYMSYVGCPHHINHKADNPLMARGFIVDATYNNKASALSECPTCHIKTADKQNRDRTGIHCAKCGTVVKDEFVEILIAVDTKKEPKFAENVRNGTLRAGSMGCECDSTECNVCSHVAYSKPEFCKHIKPGNKGTWWAKNAQGGFDKINLGEVRRAFVQRGYTGANTVDAGVLLTLTAADGYEARKAFEKCCGVAYKEYSRVHRPADPKALQREVLDYRAQLNTLEANAELKNETEILLLRTKLAEVEQQLAKVAGIDQEGDLEVTHNPAGDEVVIRDIPGEGESPADGAPGPMGIEEFTQEELAPGEVGETKSEEMGVLPPAPAVSPSARDGSLYPGAQRAVDALLNRGGKMDLTFEKIFVDWSADVTDRGNVRVADGSDAPILIIRPKQKITSEDEGRKLCAEVMKSLLTNGLTSTINAFKASVGPRIAQVVDYAEDDYQGFEDKYMFDSAREDREDDIADTPTDKADSFTDDGHDMDVKLEDQHPTKGVDDSTLTDREVDHEDYKNDRSPDDLSSTEPKGSDMRDQPRKDMDVGKNDALEGVETDHTTSLTGSAKVAETTYTAAEYEAKIAEETEKLNDRYKKIFEKKMAAREKAIKEKVANLEEELTSRFARALKIVSRRRQLNQSESPLKAQMFDTLANDKIVGRNAALGIEYTHAAMEADLASHLIEASYAEASEADINDLVKQARLVMAYDETYLLSVEEDLGGIDQPLPVVASVVEATYQRLGPVGQEADRLRMEAANGNMNFAPSGQPTNLGSEAPNNREQTARDIGMALGNTRIARKLGSLRTATHR